MKPWTNNPSLMALGQRTNKQLRHPTSFIGMGRMKKQLRHLTSNHWLVPNVISENETLIFQEKVGLPKFESNLAIIYNDAGASSSEETEGGWRSHGETRTHSHTCLAGQVSDLSVILIYLLVLFFRRLIGSGQLKLCTISFLIGISNRKISDS